MTSQELLALHNGEEKHEKNSKFVAEQERMERVFRGVRLHLQEHGHGGKIVVRGVLNYPPSANVYWRSSRGRVFVSSEARAYKAEVAALALTENITPMDGDLIICLDFYRPRRAGDLDNRIKVCLDALNKLVWHDDSQIVEIHARRFDDKKNPRVEINVNSKEENAPA